jgi:hypothetical protein
MSVQAPGALCVSRNQAHNSGEEAMPDFIDKFNASAFAESNPSMGPNARGYCECLAKWGRDEVASDTIKFFDISEDYFFLCVEKTKPRNNTRSFEVYMIASNLMDYRITHLVSALCGKDREGQVKVNYRFEVDQMLKLINPDAQIKHV